MEKQRAKSGPKGLPTPIKIAIRVGKAHKIPQADLADILGVHKQTVYKFSPDPELPSKHEEGGKLSIWQHRAILKAKMLRENPRKTFLQATLTNTILGEILGIDRRNIPVFEGRELKSGELLDPAT